MRTQALVLDRQHELSLRDIELPAELSAHDVRVHIHTVGICGSDAVRIVSGCTCTPSQMIPALSPPQVSAAPTNPGSRLPNWLIALNRCVTQRAPASA